MAGRSSIVELPCALNQDSVASASETGEEYEDSDDSDMYMEPDGAETETETETEAEADESGKEQQREEQTDEADTTEQAPSEVTEKTEEATKYNTSSRVEPRKSKDQQAENTKETGETDEPDASSPEEDKSLETDSQNFFPSFAELFANHRLSFAEQQRYRPNRFLGYLQRDRSGYQTAAATAKDPLLHHPLLGSGNFGVIRGGTYYPEEKENDEYATDDGSPYNPYYHGGSRGRANYLRNPKPQPIRGGDFFANFRDFADITAPPKSSFSHLSVVYANKNDSSKSDATSTGRITEPRNIIETLRMLEEEAMMTGSEATTTEPPPRKKQSKGKWKLAKMRQYEEDKARRSRMTVEPLLALS
ncbi:hypothetical protein E2986_13611 [Frieseomelitta varia]|uniref:Uncharacterized protein n=1 Tax=Frieseomelitta varia TaxID=561572 RepID=A0A833RTM5_9HYME|nr:hypothetical protein E2986_13611 [Frieseomelitta varia]